MFFQSIHFLYVDSVNCIYCLNYYVQKKRTLFSSLLPPFVRIDLLSHLAHCDVIQMAELENLHKRTSSFPIYVKESERLAEKVSSLKVCAFSCRLILGDGYCFAYCCNLKTIALQYENCSMTSLIFSQYGLIVEFWIILFFMALTVLAILSIHLCREKVVLVALNPVGLNLLRT